MAPEAEFFIDSSSSYPVIPTRRVARAASGVYGPAWALAGNSHRTVNVRSSRAAGYNPCRRIFIGDTQTRRTTGVLLAGGQSSRMGREKPLQVVGGVSMIERVRAAVSHCVDEIVIVTNRPDLYGFLGMPMISDTYRGRGPLGGLHAALKQMGSPAALVAAADYPFLEPGALRRIVVEDPAGGVVVPRVEGSLHPLCALYARDCITVLEESLVSGELMVLSFIARLRQKVLDETELGPAASRIFFNVNTPEDLRRAEEILAQAQSRG